MGGCPSKQMLFFFFFLTCKMNTMAVLVHLVAGLQRNPAGLRELRWICIAAAAFLHDMSAAAFSGPV